MAARLRTVESGVREVKKTLAAFWTSSGADMGRLLHEMATMNKLLQQHDGRLREILEELRRRP